MESKNEENFFTVEIAQDTLDRIIGLINACDTKVSIILAIFGIIITIIFTGNKDGVSTIVFSELSYINFIEKLVENTPNDNPKSWFEKYNTNEYGIYYSANIIKTDFNNWIENGMN